MDKQIYLVHGGDSFIVKSKMKSIIAKYDVDDFNINIYDAEEENISKAINDASTIPFMADEKIVIIKNAYFLTNEKLKKEISHDIAALVRYLDNPVKETILIITAPYLKLDERKAITKALKKEAEVVFCEAMKKVDLTNWIRRQIGKQGLRIEKAAIDEFLKRVENNTQVAVNEMKKLLLYAEGKDVIRVETIKKIVTKNIEDNVYEITNNILENKRSEALEIYNDLIMHSEDPLRILGILVNKYREILQVKLLLKDGKDQAGVAAYYRCSSGRAYYMVKNARSVRMDVVKKHLLSLEELDYSIKSGQIDKKIGIELFILGT